MEHGRRHVVTCYGPGTPYNDNEPKALGPVNELLVHLRVAVFGCARRPVHGDGDHLLRVSWVARGAPGGGNLGLVAGATARTIVRVEQAEA